MMMAYGSCVDWGSVSNRLGSVASRAAPMPAIRWEPRDDRNAARVRCRTLVADEADRRSRQD